MCHGAAEHSTPHSALNERGVMGKYTASGEPRMNKTVYERELKRLQAEHVVMNEWIRRTGQRVVVLFEGRDAAGKGSAINRITQYANPRHVRTVALPAPTDREKTQWYFQRYIQHLPAAGEMVLFDRSWYNRAGVERVMDFCSEDQYWRFLRQAPNFEKMLVDDGFMVLKYWFSVSDLEQEARFRSRAEDPMRRWKLSPMDVESLTRWEDYSRAKDIMMEYTDTDHAPWYTVESEDKRTSRINVMAHMLDVIPYEQVELPAVEFPERPKARAVVRPPQESQRHVPNHAAAVEAAAKDKGKNKDD